MNEEQSIKAEVGASMRLANACPGPDNCQERIVYLVEKCGDYSRQLAAVTAERDQEISLQQSQANAARQLGKDNASLRDEVAGYAATMALQHRRMVDANGVDEKWRKAHNKPGVWPDLGELLTWLDERAEKAEAERDQALKANVALYQDAAKRFNELVHYMDDKIIGPFKDVLEQSMLDEIQRIVAESDKVAAEALASAPSEAGEREKTKDETLTVWKDGTHRVWRKADAYYARNDPDWLMDFDLRPAALVAADAGKDGAG